MTPGRAAGTALWPALAVAAAAVLPRLPGLSGPFIFDDLNTIAQNPALRHPDLLGFLTDPTLASVKPGNWPWRPLLLLFDALRFGLFDLRPTGWHLSQLLVHALNSVLVFFVARRVFKLSHTAIFAGLLFAVAPVQAQAALYLSARSMVVALPFALGALLAATGGAERWRPAVAAGLVFLAMLASEGALVTAGWIGLALWARAEPLDRRRLMPVAAALFAGGLYHLLRALLPAPTGLELLNYWRDSFDWKQHALSQLTAPFALGRYFFLPTGSSFFHDAPPLGFFSPRVLAATAALLAAGGLVALAHRRPGLRPGAAGLAWYLGSLLPAVFTPLNIELSEHRAYLALPGLCLAAAWLLDRLLVAASDRARLRRAVVAAAGLVVLMDAASAVGRAAEWRSDEAVFRDTVRHSPGYFAAWSMLGAAAYGRGDCRRALADLDRAVALRPGFADGYNTRAACFIREGNSTAALESASRAARLDPQNPTYMNSVAVALMGAGREREALPWLERALQLAPANDPNRPMMERNRARCLAALGQTPP